MTLQPLTFDALLAGVLATIICVAMLCAYGWGYRAGVAYCVRELGPFEELLKQLKDSRKKL
jgi:hypothetical protein